jgi:hypothetical protein
LHFVHQQYCCKKRADIDQMETTKPGLSQDRVSGKPVVESQGCSELAIDALQQ